MKNKKSVLLYCDIIHTVEKLDDKTAGLLFKHYLRYINDLNPETDNLLVEISFEPMKQNLKRDLKKWEIRAERSRSNGSLGGRPKKIEEPKITQQVILKPRKPVKDTVTVTVKDKVINKEEKFLSLFNELKSNKYGKSNFKVLSKTDKNNLKQLSNYTLKDFKTVISVMLGSEWAKNTGNQTPTHVLRVENFNRYLSQGNTLACETDEERNIRLTKEAQSQ